jgi:hypothetical protein
MIWSGLLFFFVASSKGELYTDLDKMQGTMDMRHQALRLFTGLDPEDAAAVRSETRPIVQRAAMFGDSTTRNQFQFLCDILLPLGDARPWKTDNHSPTPKTSKLRCKGESWISGGSLEMIGYFDMRHALPASTIPKIIKEFKADLKLSENFDFIYFGSSALHYLQLMPYRDPDQDKRIVNGSSAVSHFSDNLRGILSHVRSATNCPIFHTVNYICEESFRGKWQSVIENPEMNRKACHDATQPMAQPLLEEQLCRAFIFSSNGSEAVATIERQVLRNEASEFAALRIVDNFKRARHKCWATRKEDGRHYLPLLPFAVKSLLDQASTCPQQSYLNFTAVQNYQPR